MRPHMTRVSDVLACYAFNRPSLMLIDEADQKLLKGHFGIDSDWKFSAFLNALREGEIRASQLEEICGNGPKITEWLSECRLAADGLTFVTDYD